MKDELIFKINKDYQDAYSSSTNKKADVERTIKLAVIRGHGLQGCPFGLSIPDACSSAGSSVNRMAPVKENDKDLIDANNLVYLYHKDNKQCPFASKILENYKKVDCDYGDTAQGMGDPAWQGSNLYPNVFNGLDVNGLNTNPLGFYTSNETSRNMFYGLFSLLGNKSSDDIIKIATNYIKNNETDKKEILNHLIQNLRNLKKEYSEDFEKLEKYLDEYKKEANKNNISSGFLYDLSESWFSPRQNNDG